MMIISISLEVIGWSCSSRLHWSPTSCAAALRCFTKDSNIARRAICETTWRWGHDLLLQYPNTFAEVAFILRKDTGKITDKLHGYGRPLKYGTHLDFQVFNIVIW